MREHTKQRPWEEQFRSRLRDARKKIGYTQGELGRRTKLSTSAIYRLEGGYCKPSPDSLRRLAGALNVSVDFLLGLRHHRQDWLEDVERMRTAIVEQQAEIEAWKTASQLEVGGDPDGLFPRHLAAYIAELDALCVRLSKERHEAARLGYCAGHNDTVEGTYADPGEVAADICQEIDGDWPC
jgi:transcriptional regulator with XRE-family HTH domain